MRELLMTIMPLGIMVHIKELCAHTRSILIDARVESNLEKGKLCPKARKRKAWIINAT
jgi:hypothetical protein